MSNKTIYTISGVVLLFIALITIGVMNFSAKNTEVDLSTSIKAQQVSVTNCYDKMWKILHEKAGVADQYKDSFKDIYQGLIEGRYSNQGSNDGSLMKFIQEHNPNFDVSLYKDLMNSIEIERTGFFNEQQKLIDLNREHDALLAKVPSKWFLGSVKPIEIHIITSAKTKSVVASGEDNDVDLFPKK